MRKLVLLSDISKCNSLLEEKIGELLNGNSLKLGYIPSQTDKNRKYFKKAKVFFERMGFKDFLYFDVDSEYDESLIDQLITCDAIYLSGGNTFSFLKSLKSKQMLPLLRDVVDSGKVLIGVSAGSILMSKTIRIAEYIDENTVELDDLSSLALVDFDFMPHWEHKQHQEEKLFQEYYNKTLYTCSDGDGIIIMGEQMYFCGDISEIREGKIKPVWCKQH
ncbi:peptidase S51 [Bacillus cereus]|uniref:Type 1 glutamine amidotransferase-like domain-containing protein n=1 Tax=Bacillus paramycoides TaxID=2026194 RepID=UPI000BF7520B|nr:Type 1 glutamine amidotransferase-like domain-containing protein [Bacillus paramycoides]PFD29310.1 peptidase S51 [Bacillus cereus]PGM58948.1 peptidase S51 [Bacillus cereus]